MRMFFGEVIALGEDGDLRYDHEDVALRQVELAVTPVTQTGRRLDDGIKHGLEPLRTRHRAEDLINRLTLLAQVLVLPDELFDVERLAALHPLLLCQAATAVKRSVGRFIAVKVLTPPS
jgi:hypothetical protein